MKYTNNIWGFNAFGHGASLCVIKDNNLIYYKKSHDDFLNQQIVDEALSFGKPRIIGYYEKFFSKRLRHLFSGEYLKAFSILNPKLHMMEFGVYTPIKYFSHHYSHAAAAYYLSTKNSSLILVADAIGEWDTLTIWHGSNNKLKKLYSRKYPYSLGLLYTSFSKKLKITEKELMLKSTNGSIEDLQVYKIKQLTTKNLHKGLNFVDFEINENTPRCLQYVFVNELKSCLYQFKHLSKNVIFAGGCAYNKYAADELGATVTISPGDESSSIGAACGLIGEKVHIKKDLYVDLQR